MSLPLQIVVEEFLEDINNMLNSGEVPNLFPSDEYEKIIAAMRPKAKECGISEGDRCVCVCVCVRGRGVDGREGVTVWPSGSSVPDCTGMTSGTHATAGVNAGICLGICPLTLK